MIRALQIIATAWSFSGGAYLGVEARTEVIHQRFESNAKAVETELLTRRGLKRVTVGGALGSFETMATYREPPLRIAAENREKRDLKCRLEETASVLPSSAWGEYYQYAHREHSSWFMSLYKVRDAFSLIYGKSARTSLRASQSDWDFFWASSQQ